MEGPGVVYGGTRVDNKLVVWRTKVDLAPRCPYIAGMAAGIQIAVRLEAELLARVDAVAPKLSTEWRHASRSDVIRALIVKALPLLEGEGEHAEAKRPKTR